MTNITVLKFVGFSVGKANTFMAIIFFYVIPLYCFWPLHSDWTRERMWHFVLPILFALPCYVAWTWASAHQSFGGISSVSIYGLAFLGHLSSITQPVMLSYRSSTLYGAAEQAVGGGIQISAVYLASIISPQVSQPNLTSPLHRLSKVRWVCMLRQLKLTHLDLSLFRCTLTLTHLGIYLPLFRLYVYSYFASCCICLCLPFCFGRPRAGKPNTDMQCRREQEKTRSSAKSLPCGCRGPRMTAPSLA